MSGEQRAFFDLPMMVVAVDGLPPGVRRAPQAIEEPVALDADARVRIAAIDPADPVALPDGATPIPVTGVVSVRNSGNRTLQAPKRSWKVEVDQFDAPDGAEPGSVAGMTCLNLKSMWNDPSQMREGVAWWLMHQADLPASRHSYARLGLDGHYTGLYSVIEQVDAAFLAARFPGPVVGNLYKVGCGAIGCGTLEYRRGSDGDDSGRQYRDPKGRDELVQHKDSTYRLRSFSDRPGAKRFDDLAALIRTLNGVGLPGGEDRFGGDAFADAVRAVFDVERFLRWAGVNVLLGAWDNYYATPANYYLYNAGTTPGEDIVGRPYFTLIPWDYDNCLGLDYFGTRWQDTDLIDWPANTVAYHVFNGDGPTRTRLPLLQNLLRNRGFRRYYLDHVEHLLDGAFTRERIDRRTAALWSRVVTSAYLESDTPFGAPFTGRQFCNDEVYRNGSLQWELRHGGTFAHGIRHYVAMRVDSAREQLVRLRRDDPSGSSGASFAAVQDT